MVRFMVVIRKLDTTGRTRGYSLSFSLSLSGSLALSKSTSSQPTISFVRRQYKYSYSALSTRPTDKGRTGCV